MNFIMYSGDPYKNPFNDWLKQNALWLVLTVAAILLIVVVVIVALNLKSKKAIKSAKSPEKPIDFANFVGGKDNIISVNMNGSRISLELKDYSLVNDEKLKENKVLSILKMSNKITLVCDKGDVTNIFNSLN